MVSDDVAIDLAIGEPEALRAIPAVAILTAEIKDVLGAALDLRVVDAAGVEWASAVLGQIKKRRTEIERLRVQFTKPLVDHTRTLQSFFRSFDVPLADADAKVRVAVLGYRNRLVTEARAEQARLDAEAAARLAAAPEEKSAEQPAEMRSRSVAASLGFVVPLPDVAPPKTTSTPLGSTTVRTTWDFEVVAFHEIPVEFLMVDTPKVRLALAGGKRSLPGLHIFERESVVVRAPR